MRVFEEILLPLGIRALVSEVSATQWIRVAYPVGFLFTFLHWYILAIFVTIKSVLVVVGSGCFRR
jgi:hypothetical protein